MKNKKPTIKTPLHLLEKKDMSVDVEQIGLGLLEHKFSDKAKKTMLLKQTQKTKIKTPRELIEEEIENCIHRLPDGKVGFPAAGFYNGMREVAPYLEGMNKKLVSGSIRILGEQGTSLVRIDHKSQVTQEDIGILNSGVPKVIYRPRFDGWKCRLHIMFDSSQVSPEQIINLLNYAGFHRGIGDWRPGAPKKPGSHGMYKVSQGKSKKQ